MTEPATKDYRSDTQLFAAINRGDVTAFESLLERYGDWALALARRFTRNDADARDVVQDVFMYLLRKAPHLTLSSRATTFLYPAVKHAALTRLRLRNREGNLTAEAMRAMTAPMSPPRTESLGGLAAAVERLPEAQRETVLMRYVDGMAQEEIAAALEIPVGTVKSRLHHALRALREDPRLANYFA